MNKNQTDNRQTIYIFTAIVCIVAIAAGLSNTIFSNYFKEAFQITSEQRGFIEIPRESPGILCAVFISLLAGLGDVTIAILTQILVMIGLMVMGLLNPSYGVMLIFLFIHSLGMHLFMPLNDSISMALAKEGEVGKTLGYFKSRSNFCTMLTACIVFVGFRTKIFSFTEPVILPFSIAFILTIIACVLLIILKQKLPKQLSEKKKNKLIFRKAYMPYYLTLVAYGCQKRIKLVFGPWIIIELMGKGADTIALLGIITSFVGTFFSKKLGTLLDKKGLKVTLIFEGVYLMVISTALGLAAGALEKGMIEDKWIFIIYIIYILSYLLDQFNMVHAYMMRQLAVHPSEVTESLSIGLSIDHILAIVISAFLGIIWERFGAAYVFYLTAATASIQIMIGIYLGRMNMINKK